MVDVKNMNKITFVIIIAYFPITMNTTAAYNISSISKIIIIIITLYRINTTIICDIFSIVIIAYIPSIMNMITICYIFSISKIILTPHLVFIM